MIIVKSPLFKNLLFGFITIFLFGFQPQLFAQEESDLYKYSKMSLEELMNREVVSASKVAQKIKNVPAAIKFVREDILL